MAKIMVTIIKIIGIIIACLGILYFLKPVVIRRLIEFFKKGKRIYFVGVLRFALAVVFLLAARECDVTWVIFVFGILFLAEGLVIFLMKNTTLSNIFEWYQKQSDLVLRIMALIALAIGIIIIFCA